MPSLFDQFDLSGTALRNRIVMAPMTRTRATPDRSPTELMARYYAQRASAGLIVTECTAIREDSAGIINAPGIYRDDQIAGWRRVTDAVHDAGGRIFLQIWHCGRISHSTLQPGGLPPIAPSPIVTRGSIFTVDGTQPFEVPRQLNVSEIQSLVEGFGRATRNARSAGFDGVELHGGFGYLVDQFLQDGTNSRTDIFGGSVSNRARFLLEIIEEMCGAWSADRIGVKLTPATTYNGQSDSDVVGTFSHAVAELSQRHIAYVHLTEPTDLDRTAAPVQMTDVTSTLGPIFRGTVITNGGYDSASAQAVLEHGSADLISFGTTFISNPDLPRRLAESAVLNQPDFSSFYGFGPKGYIDYPMLSS